MSPPHARRTVLLTLLAILAFAGNSILCRLALSDGSIDPASFTCVRLTSGALALLPILLRQNRGSRRPWSPMAALALVGYAIAFSFAFVTLSTATGALLLFGCVQLSMLGWGFRLGERMNARQLSGFVAALAGVILLVLPGLSAPDPVGAILMSIAGLGWGAYSLIGRTVDSPRLANACNFALAAPVVVLLWLVVPVEAEWSARGIACAVASGAGTSAVGYIVWYAALAGHNATSAAIVQLAVPLVAAAGGVVLVGEGLTARFAVASSLTLGGVAVAVIFRRRAA